MAEYKEGLPSGVLELVQKDVNEFFLLIKGRPERGNCIMAVK
jgi:hypothetical protein